MITLRGNQYKLCLIDTNIISEMIIRYDKFLGNYFIKFNLGEFIPCFSIFTILELRQRKAVYNQFLDLFTKIPCLIVKNTDILFNDEVNSYPYPKKNSPILVASPSVLVQGGYSLRELLETTFRNEEITKYETKWNSEKLEILEGILGLVKNYPPLGKKYTQKEIHSFIEIAGFQQIIFRNKIFAQEIVHKGKAVSIDAFPSIKMMCYTVFYKFYIDQRRAIESDTFDLIISSVVPYVDAVITEKNMAEIFRKTQKQDDFLQQLEIYSLKILE